LRAKKLREKYMFLYLVDIKYDFNRKLTP